MSKRLILTLVLSVVSGSLLVLKATANDLKQNGLRGAVKTISITEYPASEKGLTFIRTFDQEGRLIKEVLKDETDNLLYISSFKPFENGKFAEYTNYDEQGRISSKESMRLDASGRILSMKSFNEQDELLYSISSHFDKQGNVTSTKKFNTKNELMDSKIFSYDGYGRLSYIKHSPQGEESFYEFFSYSDNGEVKEHKSVTVSGDVLNQTINEFDAEGNKTQTTVFPSLTTTAEHQISKYDRAGRLVASSFVTGDDVVIHKEEYVYTDKGVKQKSSVYDLINEVLTTSYIISYDENGNEISRVNYDEKGIPNSYIETSYEYDEYGNWLIKIEKNKEDLLSVVKREIEYY